MLSVLSNAVIWFLICLCSWMQVISFSPCIIALHKWLITALDISGINIVCSYCIVELTVILVGWVIKFELSMLCLVQNKWWFFAIPSYMKKYIFPTNSLGVWLDIMYMSSSAQDMKWSSSLILLSMKLVIYGLLLRRSAINLNPIIRQPLSHLPYKMAHRLDRLCLMFTFT